MDALVEFGKIILPAGLVLYAMFLTVKMFINKEYDQKLIDIKLKNLEVALPIRLQAYERICLFLERIAPKNMLMRLNVGELTAMEFQHILLHEIREEYNHNVSQQVYMSTQAWDHVKDAKEEIVMIINESVAGLEEGAKSIDLSRKILENIVSREVLLIDSTLIFVKEEIHQAF